MLPSNHGAYTVGKSLRRPIMKNINAFSFVGKSNLASIEAMGSAIAGISRKRASPSVTRSISSNSLKTWQPSHGIIFKDASAPGSPRLLSTTTLANHEQNLAIHSFVEDTYVLANSHVEDSKTMKVATAQGEILKSEEASADDVQAAADVQKILREIEEKAAKKELPISESTYKMTKKLFKEAKKAKAEAPESYWSHTLYRGPEENGVPRKVKVHYCRSVQTTEQTLNQYFVGKKVLGFDIEWKADARTTDGAKKNVSLIQLATEERVGLFHIALFPQNKASQLVAPTMKTIMEDPNITKVGVAISADCTRLRKYLDIHSAGIFELSHLHRLVKYTQSQEYDQINKKLVSLAKQVEEHLHLPMYKGGNVRSSDWSRGLSIKQIAYAASDSYAGYHLYDILETKRRALDPVPPRPFHADENQPMPVTGPSTSTPKTRKSTRRQVIEDPLPLDPDFSVENPLPLGFSLEAPQTTFGIPLEAAIKAQKETKIPDPLTEISTSEHSPSNSNTSQPPNPTPSTPLNPPETDSNPTPEEEKESILLAAEILALLHLSSNPDSKLSKPALIAYFIWYHHTHLSIPEIIEILVLYKDKASNLKQARIVKNILFAITEDGLSYEKERLREILGMLPRDMVWECYRELAVVVGA